MRAFDVVVIGGGPGGYVAAIRCAQLGLKTACIESRRLMGGTCLNVGCIPSKTLLYATELLAKVRDEGEDYGIETNGVVGNLPAMMQRKQRVVEGLARGIDGLFRKHGITRIAGVGSIVAPGKVEVAGEQLLAKQIILATGSEPTPLSFLPFDEERILSSTGALALQEVPKKLIVVGAGVIGLELGSVYRRLGTEVTFVEFLDRVCPVLDHDLSKVLGQIMKKQGLSFHLSSRVIAGQLTEEGVALQVQGGEGQVVMLEADRVLVAIGRRPYTAGLGLERVGIVLDKGGRIPVDGQFCTTASGIYAIGDVIDGPMLAHKASEEGVAVAEILAGKSPRIHYATIPNVVYTWPEVATVGLSEEEGRQAGLTIKTGTFPMRAVSRAHCTGDLEGLVKIVADQATDRLLGVHIIGAQAGECIHEAVVAMENGATVTELAAMSHAHPTYSEAIREAALATLGHPLHL